MAAKKIKVGDKIVFLGHTDEVPEDQQFLTEQEVYEVADVNPAEKSVGVEIANPDFNKKKPVSETNPEVIIYDIFEGEYELYVEEEEADEPAPKAKGKTSAKVVAKPAAKGRAKAAEPEEADEPEEDPEEDPEEADEPEEEAPAPKAKGKATAKAPAKAAAKAPAKAAAKAPAKATGKGKTTAKVPAKAKEKPVEEEEVILSLEHEDEEILALVEEADDLLELATELVDDAASLDYKVGGVLFHIRLTKAYRTLDKRYAEKGGFELYVKEHLKMEYRKAMYLVDIYYKFNLFGLDGSKVQEMGWTKASKIAAVMDTDNAEDLVELATSSTVADLVDSIKESYKSETTETNKVKRITFKFRLPEERGAAVQQILEDVMERYSYKDIGDAIEHIVTEWAADHTEAKPKAKATAKSTAKPARRAKQEEAEAEDD